MRRVVLLALAILWCLVLVAPVHAQGSVIHIVQRGENLYRIALRYGVTVQAIAAANGIVNPHRIYAGQRLVIPRSATAPSPSPASGVGRLTHPWLMGRPKLLCQ